MNDHASVPEKVTERKDKQKAVALKDIAVSDRARSNLGNIDELVESIREKGIIQPITLDENLNLLAGGRRYAAAAKLGLKSIPCIIRPFVSQVDSKEIELIENIHRLDFTWQERAALVGQIHDLYKEKKKETGEDWSVRKTAQLIDRSVGGTSDAIFMAEALKMIPGLKAVPTEDAARKFLKKTKEQALTNELAKRQLARREADLPHENDFDKNIKRVLHIADSNYHVGDTFAGMAELKTGGMIHFIECDPPYGIDLNEQKSGRDSEGSTVEGYEEISREKYPDFLERLTKELYRIAYKDCWMVFWYGPSWHTEVLANLKAAGWEVDDIPAIWVKASGQTQQPNLYLARTYEPFFICRKGKPVLNKPGRANTFPYNGCPTQGANAKYHPTQRPVELIEELLKTFTVGQVVTFVPFLGSGATLRACYNHGVHGFGYDLNGQYKPKFMLAVEEDCRKNLLADKEEG